MILKKMNRIIFHLDDSRNFRGGERQVIYLAREAQKLGEKNYIVAREDSPLINEASMQAIGNFTLPYLFEWDFISAIILALKAKKICSTSAIPIFHSHTGHTSAIALMASSLIKSIRITHRRVDFPIKQNFLSRIKYSRHTIIAISNAIKDILIKCHIDENKIKVIHSSFELSKSIDTCSMRKDLQMTYNLPKDAIILGSLIALVPHKDPINLIRAAAFSIKKNKKLFFFIGGEGKLKSKCEAEIQKLKINNNCKLLGQIKENISFLKALDIFVISSREEGLGSVLLEAMACGLPLVGTKAGGIPELIIPGVNGLMAEKENPLALSEMILKLANDVKMREKFSISSLQKLKEFSPKEMAIKTIMVYDEAIKNFEHN